MPFTPKRRCVIIADRLLELGQVAQAVLPLRRIGSGIAQRLDHVVVRSEIRRADRQVVDGAALGLKLQALGVERAEDLRAKPIKTLGKLHVQSFLNIDKTNRVRFIIFETIDLGEPEARAGVARHAPVAAGAERHRTHLGTVGQAAAFELLSEEPAVEHAQPAVMVSRS